MAPIPFVLMRSATLRSAAAPTSAHALQLMLNPGSPCSAAMMSQRIQECVRRRMVGLAGRAQQRRNGREQQEEVQGTLASQSMQVPGSGHFGSHDSRKTIPILLEQKGVIESAGGVNHPAQRRQ